jgi:hypothetical protein
MAVPYLLTFGWEQRYKIKNTSHKKWYKAFEGKKLRRCHFPFFSRV